MPFGPGKYDEAATVARRMTGGDVLLIVVGGAQGGGFSAQCSPALLARLPALLRGVADDIEQDVAVRAARKEVN